MTLPISVVIPTLNEEKYLPRLLTSLQNQSRLPREIIVADAFSKDHTRRIARKFGCKIVNGGHVGKSRNNGASAARQKVLLFLDADVILPLDFLEKSFAEFERKNLDIASCYFKPLSSRLVDLGLHEVVNSYFRATKSFHPHVPGFCIFVKKTIHKTIHGFDEKIVFCEDHDYVKRAKKIGRFSYLRERRVFVSVRRFEEEGRTKVALKYVTAELHLIFLGQIRKQIFDYRFGSHL